MTFLPGTYNSRDVGGIPVEDGVIRRGRLIRSDAPVALGAGGRALLEALGVRSALDLREPSEIACDPLDLDGLGVRILERPIIDGALAPARAMSLGDIYGALLEHRGAQLTAAVRALSAPDVLPAVVLCSAGKDRTGLVVALTLGAVGASEDAIVADFAATEDNLTDAYRETVLRRARAARLVDQEDLVERIAAPAGLMRDTLTRLGRTYDGPRGFLRHHGMSEVELASLARGLVEPRALAA